MHYKYVWFILPIILNVSFILLFYVWKEENVDNIIQL